MPQYMISVKINIFEKYGLVTLSIEWTLTFFTSNKYDDLSGILCTWGCIYYNILTKL